MLHYDLNIKNKAKIDTITLKLCSIETGT